jgi:hypothetical protein
VLDHLSRNGLALNQMTTSPLLMLDWQTLEACRYSSDVQMNIQVAFSA